MAIEIKPRAAWNARAPRSLHLIPIPTVELWEHHTVGDYRGAAGIKAIQDFHMNVRGWSDIAYSFIIERRTMVVYEGRGAGVAGGHTKGRNTISHAICVTGNFDLYQPPDELLRVIAKLVRHGWQQGWWAEPRLTGGHRDAPGASTACPGKYLYLAIPQINRYANEEDTPVHVQHVERIERVLAELGYTINIDQQLDDREVAAVENMMEGIQNLIAKERDLKAAVADLRTLVDSLRAQVEEGQRATGLLAKIRQLLT